MNIKYFDESFRWDQKLLCVTHADRPTEEARCNLNFFGRRYSDPARLPARIPFSSLTPISMHQPYGGSITLWTIKFDPSLEIKLRAFFRPDYKPQHAIWYEEKLWVLGVDRLVVYSVKGDSITQIGSLEDPWLSGGHTIAPDGGGRLLLSCSGSDSVLVVDAQTLKIEKAWRVPESIYGRNFDLRREDSVVDHFIPNDLQLTHVNCAWPWRNGIVISTQIQGAIGWFSPEGDYRELTRGFLGCHGVRSLRQSEGLYFSDSAVGILTLLDEGFRIKTRVGTGSIWLHDSLELAEDIFIMACGDRNRIEFFDIKSCAVRKVIPCKKFGKGPQFFYYGS
jgi:hypothetical protein